MSCTIEALWDRAGFEPNESQRKAILHTDGPLLLTAGPGSGKTRVLLWRTLNLIVFHQVLPEEIFLGTFTEKAALQLRQGLLAYLSDASRLTGHAYDLSRMPLGTVHSTCRRILADRRFSRGRMRPGNITLVDDLDQYFVVHKKWTELLASGGFEKRGNEIINEYITGRRSKSRHGAVAATISLFNRLSEECIDPESARREANQPVLKKLMRMYAAYRKLDITDLSLLQRAALEHCRASEGTSHVLRHVIVDEYQDTNHVQEAIFFHLARGHRNLCVVGDDDQALYRFRGSTVENLVEFENRCREKLGQSPRTINLGRNYRSQRRIVEFYSDFITRIDWHKGAGRKGSYRIENKRIVANSKDRTPAVVATTPGAPEEVCREVATLVKRLLDEGKVSDPNQIAFLYPSLHSVQARRMIGALEAMGLKVYAPRAGQFLNVPEALDVFGVFLVLFGSPTDRAQSGGMQKFLEWVERAHTRGQNIVRGDRKLATFIEERQREIERTLNDRRLLVTAVGEESLEQQVTPSFVKRITAVKKLSPQAKSYLRRGLRRLIDARHRTGRPLSVGYIVNRVTTLDWGLLDLFYEFTGFNHFRHTFERATSGDEGPVCNLALVSKYLSRFQALNAAVLSASFLEDGKFTRTLFNSFLYALWRRGESEYEDADDPFPRGRIPFLTVHQAKGLEFPVVVLGNPSKRESVQQVERIVRPLLGRRQAEPLDRIAGFDVARMFYVALSRPKHLLVLCHYSGPGQSINEPFRTLLDSNFPRIAALNLTQIPQAALKHEEELPKAYSYTGDYLSYRTCPRRYMFYRGYDFAPSRAQTMLFGSLVHRTIEDLHEWLHAQTEAGRKVS